MRDNNLVRPDPSQFQIICDAMPKLTSLNFRKNECLTNTLKKSHAKIFFEALKRSGVSKLELQMTFEVPTHKSELEAILATNLEHQSLVNNQHTLRSFTMKKLPKSAPGQLPQHLIEESIHNKQKPNPYT